MATVSTRHYMRPRKGRSGFDLLQASDAPEDEKRLGLEGYKPSDPDTAKAAVGYNSRGFAQGEDAYRLGLKERPVEVAIGTPTTLWRKEQPKDEDWGDGKRGGATGATGRELDEAGMLGTGPDVEVGIGTPSLVRRGALEQDWTDGKMSGASNPKARGGPGISVGASSKAPGDADYLDRLKGAATLPGKAETPFSDSELSAMFESTPPGAEESDPALEAAQAQGRETNLAAAIGRAGAHLNESLTGAKYDRTAYDGYAANADRPVGDLLQRRKAVGERQGRARQATEDRRKAEEYARTYARQGQQDARQREQDAYGRQRDALGDSRYAAEQAEGARRFELTRRDAAAARAAARGASGASGGRQAEKDEAARLKAQAAAEADAVKRGEKLGQATSKAPYGDLQSALGALDGLSPGIIYGDAPEENPIGLGDRMLNRIPMGAGERFMGGKSIKYKSELQNLRDLISRARSGAALNQSEEAHYLSLLGDDILSDPRRAAAGINAVRRGIGQKLRDAQAAYAGPVLDNYEREGGTTYRNPVFSGQGRGAAPAPVRMQSPDGRQYTVDPSEVDEAMRNGWRTL